MNIHSFTSGFTTNASDKERRLLFVTQPENFEKKANDLQQQLDAEKAKTTILEAKVDSLQTSLDAISRKLDCQNRTGAVLRQPYAPAYMPGRGFGPSPRMSRSPYMRRSARVRPALIQYYEGCGQKAQVISRDCAKNYGYQKVEYKPKEGKLRTSYDSVNKEMYAETAHYEADGTLTWIRGKTMFSSADMQAQREKWNTQSYIINNGIRMRGNTQDQNEQFKNRRNGRKYRGGIRQASISDFSDPMSPQASYSVVG